MSARRASVLAAALLVAVFALSLSVGRYPLGPGAALAVIAAKFVAIKPWWPPVAEAIIFDIRLPRVGAALLVGAALSASGAAYQGVFRNPMASPDILGVAAGTSLGAGLGILLQWPVAAIELSAFVFGLAAAGATAFAGAFRSKGGDSALIMILAGIFIGALFSSALSILKLTADPANVLPAITFWLMGSLANIDMRELAFAAPPILIGFLLVWALRWRLDVLTFGDEEALALGVDAPRLRLVIVAGGHVDDRRRRFHRRGDRPRRPDLAAFRAALLRAYYRRPIPISAVLGGVFLLLVDDLARMFSSAEMPIGILTSLIGAPIFLYLLLSIARKGWS